MGAVPSPAHLAGGLLNDARIFVRDATPFCLSENKQGIFLSWYSLEHYFLDPSTSDPWLL